MKTIYKHTVLLLVSAALFTGCTSVSEGSGGPQTTLQGAEGLPGATELDSGYTLRQDLEIMRPVSVRKNDFLVVQFELHNKRGSQMNLEWSVEWTDEQGLKIDTNENWRPLAIGGKGYETIQITAPTPSARGWKLKVQKPNPVR